MLIKEKRKNRDKAVKREEEHNASIEALLEREDESRTIDENDLISIQERESIRLLINYGVNEIEEDAKLYHYLLEELEDVTFTTPVYREILNTFKEKLNEGEVINSQYLIQHGSPEVKKVVADLVSSRWEVSPNWSDKYKIFVPQEMDILENVVLSNVLRLKFRVLQKLITDNLDKLDKAKTGEEEDQFMKIHVELKKSEMELAKSLGIVVTR
ncbi:MAG: DNA primase, partial [Fulvivirga sp.]|nr:DNA primase [Fulvivirga sp.]